MKLTEVTIDNISDFVQSATPAKITALFAERKQQRDHLFDDAKAAYEVFQAGKRQEAERVREQLSGIDAQRQSKRAEIERAKTELARCTAKGKTDAAEKIKTALPGLCAELTALDEQASALNSYEPTGDPAQADVAEKARSLCCDYDAKTTKLRAVCAGLCNDMAQRWKECTPVYIQERSYYLKSVPQI